jgi:7-carboxy-7-deazaguanine synthase
LSVDTETKPIVTITDSTDFNVQIEMEQANTKVKGDYLSVSEIFGPTFQGEGSTIGKPCFFLRLGACNLTCGANGGWICDTSFTWDWTGINGTKYDPKEELRRMPIHDVVTKLETNAFLTERAHPFNQYASTKPAIRHLIISGGEPLLQQKSLLVLIDILVHRHNWSIEIETNGTKAPTHKLSEYVSQFNVSPKLSNSGNTVIKRVHYGVLAKFVESHKAIFKFVVSDLKDLDEIEDYVLKAGIPAHKVYIMPEGVNAASVEEHMQRVALETVSRHWNLTTRLQILVHGNKRGV